MRKRNLLLFFLSILVMFLVLSFVGIQPLAGYKDKVIDTSKSLIKANTAISPIATVESMGGWLGSYDIWFTLVPQNALPEVPYTVELYERGKLRTSQLIRFSKMEINSGRAKQIRFTLTEEDWAGLSIGSDLSSVFRVKIKQ